MKPGGALGSEFFRSNFVYIAEVYKKYAAEKNSVDASWQAFFEGLGEDAKVLLADEAGAPWASDKAAVMGRRNEFASILPSEAAEVLALEAKKAKEKPAAAVASASAASSVNANFICLLKSYRAFGHLRANIDPLGFLRAPEVKELAHESCGIKPEMMEQEVEAFGLKGKLGEVIRFFELTYTGNIGFEGAHVKNTEEREWFYSQAEHETPGGYLGTEGKKRALYDLIKAELFEHTIHVKFPGAKRFSLEGGENTIVLLENLFLRSSEAGVKEVVLGMAHRGRLNILTNVMGKAYHAVFSEFMGVSSIPESVKGSGDVKYHLGLSVARKLANGKEMYMTLTPNPSHLESVNPVVMGRARAKQDLAGDASRKTIMPVLVHGDSAMAGQGVVAECLAMANLQGYTCGGTIHVVINNQIGFTAISKETKSGTYSTDVAKMIDAPILHVNGNDALSVIRAAVIAADYRAKFGKDIVIEIMCYRKYGHNEGDEPFFTQPVMYTKIKEMKTPAAVFAEELARAGVVSAEEEAKMREEFKALMDGEFEKAKSYKPLKADTLEGNWKEIKVLEKAEDLLAVKTNIGQKEFDIVGGAISMVPEGFSLNPKIKKMLDDRRTTLLAGEKIDWATGELLAYGSLMLEGHPVRLSGEDCERGTFTHRHSVYYDQKTNEKYFPLNNMNVERKAGYEVYNSLLSEFAVLGYEYGYSLNSPKPLVIWEAQFGDFANGAVTIYDQYISSGEDKWLRMSGLVSLLPHGFEGQGPEHSSARLERYLQYCAGNNIIVANCTTPANLFHILRRQVKGDFRKPLIIMSPKSLLRHKQVISGMRDFTEGAFLPIIGDAGALGAKRVVMTSGKVYYDLLEERTKQGKEKEVAIIRVEQYYPFASSVLKAELAKFKGVKEFVWLQEEPRNMGAWSFIRDYLEEATAARVKYVGRAESASPATGFGSVHAKEQAAILTEALN